MAFSSLHICMDSPDHWFQGTIHEEVSGGSGSGGMDCSGSPLSSSGDIMKCSARPMMERRMRPPHDQALKCPRCDSTHTKFCYYNNYSLSQPRYFCKTCRRYWTKGGTLRNIPVGGGCRKNKKLSSNSKKHHQSNNNNNNDLHISHNNNQSHSYSTYPKDLQLSFPDVQFSHLSNIILGGNVNPNHSSFMESKFNGGMLENNLVRPIDFMESKLEGIIGSGINSSRSFDFFGNNNSNGGGADENSNNNINMMMLGMANNAGLGPNNFHALNCSPIASFGGMSSLNGGGCGNNSVNNVGSSYIMDSSSSCHQRMMLTYDDDDNNVTIDVKPNPKLLSLEWQDHGYSDAGKDSFGYLHSHGSWSGMINGYGSSTTNPLV